MRLELSVRVAVGLSVGEVGTEADSLFSRLDLKRLLLRDTDLLGNLVRELLIDGSAARKQDDRVRTLDASEKEQEIRKLTSKREHAS
jgi:hypothetical protein